MAMLYGQAITQGPGGQMYTDTSMQTPYNPPQQMPKMEQHIALPPKNLVNGDDLRRRQEIIPIRGQATGFDGNPIRNFGPQRGIGSFPNPFGGFMGGGRGQFMQPQPPIYGGGFGGFGMQPPMYGGGFGGFGMPPMYGGGMYGGGFGMQPPMFGGFGMQPPMYGGGFNPFSQNFYGGIGSMFPGMGGGYGMQRPPSYDGFGDGNYNIQPHPALRITPKPMPVRPSLDSLRPTAPQPIQMLRQETKGPESFQNNIITTGRDGTMIY